MAEQIKGMHLEISTNLSNINTEVKKLADTVNLSNRKLANLDANLKFKNGKELDNLKNKIIEYNKNIENTLKQKQQLINKINELQKNQKEYLNQIKKTEIVLKNATDEKQIKKLNFELSQLQKKFNAIPREIEFTNLTIDRIDRNIIKFNSDLKETNKQLSKISGDKFIKFGNKLSDIGKKLSAYITIPLIGIKAILGKITKDTILFGEKLNKTAQKINISTDNLQKFRFIAKKIGLENENIEILFQKLNKTTYELSQGIINESTDAFQQLGINIKNTSGELKNTETIFLETKNALSKITNETEKNNFIFKIFGYELGSKIAPLLLKSNEELKNLTNNFKNLTLISNENIKKSTELSNKWSELTQKLSIIKMELAISLFPIFEKFVNFIDSNLIPSIKKITDTFNSLSVNQKELIFKILGILTIMAPTVLIFGKLISIGGLLINTINLLKTAFLGLSSSMGAIGMGISIIGALLVPLLDQNEEFKKLLKKLGNICKQLLIPVIELLKNLFQALMPILKPIFTLFNGLAYIFAKIGKAIITFLIPPFNFLIKILNSIIWLINKVLTGLKYLTFGLVNVQIPSLPEIQKPALQQSTLNTKNINNSNTFNNNFNISNNMDIEETTNQILRQIGNKINRS